MQTIPKGKLISIGGAEKRVEEFLTPEQMQHPEHHLEVLGRVVKEMKGNNTKIEVITSASTIPEVIGHTYISSFESLGCAKVGVLNLRNKSDVLKKENLKRLENADGLMFSGGNQIRLTRSYLGTAFYELMLKRYYEEESFVIAGTSAGAMVMSSMMIYDGTSDEAFMSGKSNITKGFALLSNSVIDSHFVNRNRFGRLMAGVVEHPHCIGIGLAEDTGVIIREARYLECIGSAEVFILDSSQLELPAERTHAIRYRNLKSHVMIRGDKFDLNERKFL